MTGPQKFNMLCPGVKKDEGAATTYAGERA